MIEPYPDIAYRPVCLIFWNDPAPAPIVFEDGDILVSVENIRKTVDVVNVRDGVKPEWFWGWKYTILRRVKEAEK